ncbi:TPA: hypothetical protein DCX16_00330 [bacterium]|nr:hypothetical protein [bacterium]
MRKRKKLNKIPKSSFIKKPFIGKIKSLFLNEYLWLCLLLFIAIFIRICHINSLEKYDPTFYQLPYGTDMVTYDQQAQDILAGKHPTPYFYGPLYGYFLALVYFFTGRDLYVARLANSILGVLTCLLIFLIAKRVFSIKIAFVALGISVLYDMLVIHEGLLLVESLFAFLNTCCIFLLLMLEKNQSLKVIILSALFFALSILTRANILLFFPFIFLWMAIVLRKKAIKAFPIFIASTFLFIMPATIMNYIATKKFILISTSGPVNLWIGNNENANGEYLMPPKSPKLKKRLEEIGEMAHIEDSIRFIKEKPKAFLKLYLRKIYLFWGEYEVTNNMNYNQIKSYSPLIRLPIFVGFGFVAPLGLLGMLLLLKRRNTLLLQLFVFSFMMSILVIFVVGRYRIGFIPILIVFSAYSLVWFFEQVIKRKLSYKIFLLIPCFLLVWNKEIYGFLVPYIHKDGIHTEERGTWVVRDTSLEWKGGNAIYLYDGDKVKKELVINEDLDEFKEVEICAKYVCDEKPGVMVLDINGTNTIKMRLGISTQGIVKAFCIPIPKEALRNGLNSFDFSLFGESVFAFTYDQSYKFGRSYWFKDGNFERLKNGEFCIWLRFDK